MNLNSKDKIKIKATSNEWRALKDKMNYILLDSNRYPAHENTIIYYMWGYSFLDAYLRIYKKSAAIDLFNAKDELSISIPMPEIIAIFLSCIGNNHDEINLHRIIAKIDKELPIEVKNVISKFLSIP